LIVFKVIYLSAFPVVTTYKVNVITLNFNLRKPDFNTETLIVHVGTSDVDVGALKNNVGRPEFYIRRLKLHVGISKINIGTALPDLPT